MTENGGPMFAGSAAVAAESEVPWESRFTPQVKGNPGEEEPD